MQIDTNQIEKYLSSSAPDYILQLLSKPQLCLAFIYKTKNTIQNLLTQQTVILNDLLNSLKYIRNTEKPTTKTLTEAKTVLTKFSYGVIDTKKYKEKITKFLSEANIKSGNSDQFGKTDVDAKEDIFAAIKVFLDIEAQVNELVKNLNNVEEDLKLIDVSEILKNISSLTNKNLDPIEENKNNVSKIALAIDLYSSVAVLEYLTSLGNFYERVFGPILSKDVPIDVKFRGQSEVITANSISQPYPQTVTSGDFKFSTDVSYNIPFPSNAAKTRCYVVSDQASSTFNIPPNTRLYLKITAPNPPAGTLLVPEGFTTEVGVVPITLPSGIQSFSTVATAITNGLLLNDVTITLTQFGYAEHFAINGSNRLIIYGNSNVTKIEVIPPPAYVFPVFNVVTAKASNNDALFLPFQTSYPVSQPKYKDIADCISYTYPLSIENNKLKIVGQTGLTPSLTFQTGLSTDLGFTSFSVPKNEFTLIPLVNPKDYGVYDGCIFNDELSIDGNTIKGNCPAGIFDVSIYPDLVKLKPISKITKKPFDEFEFIWGPILSSPSPEQILAAEKYTTDLLAYLNNLLTSFNFTAKSSPLLTDADNYLKILENKGLDKLVNYLLASKFSTFFFAAEDEKSFGLALMSKIEKSIKNVT